MHNKIEKLRIEIQDFELKNDVELENFRIKFLGTKNCLKDLFTELKTIPLDKRKEVGQLLNSLKFLAEEKYSENKLLKNNQEKVINDLDFTLPAEKNFLGSHHPLSLVRDRILSVFDRIGFDTSEGPEIEDDWHNFTALNFQHDHPARDMQDTFFIENEEREMVMRTHTSSVQVRVMESTEPPIRTISAGRVYRNEAISSRAHCFFHQIEGLYIDCGVTFADLKQTLVYFARELFGNQAKIRMRPSYFPFTEPSAEVDVSCSLCNQNGCAVCKHSGWLEIMGCGMVDPNVLTSCGIDSKKYSGFAFGMGIERIAQLKYRVGDLRMYSENDVRFLNQFRAGK